MAWISLERKGLSVLELKMLWKIEEDPKLPFCFFPPATTRLRHTTGEGPLRRPPSAGPEGATNTAVAVAVRPPRRRPTQDIQTWTLILNPDPHTPWP